MELLSKTGFLSLEPDLHRLPFCFHPGYLDLHANTGFLYHQQLLAPVKINVTKGFKTLQFQFPPLTVTGKRADAPTEKEFCESALVFAAEKKLAHRILQPANYCLFDTVPGNAVAAAFGTYRINLRDMTEAELLRNMQPRYRSAITQVSKMNTEIRFGMNELKPFQQLHEETMKRTSAYAESYASLEKELNALPNNSMLATVYIDNILQGGLYLTYSDYSAYYHHGASSNSTQASGAIKFLHYKIMCLMKQKNVNYYDFVGARLSNVEGTKLGGIQDFKKRFGSELVKGYLWKVDLDKTACRSYDLLLKLKCKLKGTSFPKDIIDQERKKSILQD